MCEDHDHALKRRFIMRWTSAYIESHLTSNGYEFGFLDLESRILESKDNSSMKAMHSSI